MMPGNLPTTKACPDMMLDGPGQEAKLPAPVAMPMTATEGNAARTRFALDPGC